MGYSSIGAARDPLAMVKSVPSGGGRPIANGDAGYSEWDLKRDPDRWTRGAEEVDRS
jgi:hypothetical protein